MLRSTFDTTILDAGVDRGDAQTAARHVDPRTTMRHGRARKVLDRHTNYILRIDMASRTKHRSGRAECRILASRNTGSAQTLAESEPRRQDGRMSQPCYLLGAGFSRAIHEKMPLLTDLSDRVVTHMKERGANWAGASTLALNLEEWLSYLATDQPWLSLADNLRHRADFTEVAGALFAILSQAELSARHRPIPPWLGSLALHWLREKPSILTFNYDNLVERVLAQQHRDVLRGKPGSWIYLYEAPILPGPVVSGLSSGEEAPDGLMPRLLKLHGSLGWYHSGQEAGPYDPVYTTQSWGMWNVAKGETATPSSRQGAAANRMADKVPFIIPPTAVKNSHYSNIAMKAQWRAAAEALRRADELVVIGYSFPPSDVMINTMIRTEFTGGKVTVIDRHAEVANRLSNRLSARIDTSFIHSVDPVERWVASL